MLNTTNTNQPLQEEALQKILANVEGYLRWHYFPYTTPLKPIPWEPDCAYSPRLPMDAPSTTLPSRPVAPWQTPLPPPPQPCDCPALEIPTSQIPPLFSQLDKPFGQTLLDLIDQKGKTDVEVYKKAQISRKLFSKIRIGNGYVPSKPTVLSLALALELSLSETNELLKCAGFALSRSQKFDVIIEYFITQRNFDFYIINQVLYEYDLPLVGG